MADLHIADALGRRGRSVLSRWGRWRWILRWRPSALAFLGRRLGL